jgi:hypothetical protein
LEQNEKQESFAASWRAAGWQIVNRKAFGQIVQIFIMWK